MRHWYFDGAGGMFLSEDSREAYFPVQKYISEEIFGNESREYEPETELPEECVTVLRRRGSLLRASLAEDIGVGRKTYGAGVERIVQADQTVHGGDKVVGDRIVARGVSVRIDEGGFDAT